MNYITHKTIYLRKTSLRHRQTYFNMEDVVAIEKSPVRKLDIVSCFTFNFTCSLLQLHVKQPAYCHLWASFFIIHFLCSLCYTVAKPAYSFSIYCYVTQVSFYHQHFSKSPSLFSIYQTFMPLVILRFYSLYCCSKSAVLRGAIFVVEADVVR